MSWPELNVSHYKLYQLEGTTVKGLKTYNTGIPIVSYQDIMAAAFHFLQPNTNSTTIIKYKLDYKLNYANRTFPFLKNSPFLGNWEGQLVKHGRDAFEKLINFNLLRILTEKPFFPTYWLDQADVHTNHHC